MTHTLIKSLALSALSVALAACGGGGGSSASTNKPAASVGINDNNVEDVLATALQVSLDSGAGNFVEQSRPAPLVGSLGDGLSRALYTSKSQQNKTVDSATGISFSTNRTNCPFGGDALAEAELAPNSSGASTVLDLLQLQLSFDFGNCRTDSLWLDGAADLQLTSLSGLLANNSTLNINASATLTNFHVSQVAGTASQNDFQQIFNVSGKVKLAIANPDRNSLEAKLWSDGGDLIYQRRDTNAAYLHLSNFNSQINSSLLDAKYQWTTSGDFSFVVGNSGVPSNGLPSDRIKFSTPVAFSGVGFVVPNKGILRIENNNTIAELRVVDEINLAYAIDDNKDGTFDRSFHSTWAAFLKARPL